MSDRREKERVNERENERDINKVSITIKIV